MLLGLFWGLGLNVACRARGEIGDPGEPAGVWANIGYRVALEGERDRERRMFDVCADSASTWGL
jgi:hypothetical protein